MYVEEVIDRNREKLLVLIYQDPGPVNQLLLHRTKAGPNICLLEARQLFEEWLVSLDGP
jgi:hypothetical protein